MTLLRSAALLAFASLALSAAAQNLVVNGGFETGDFTNWTVTRAPGPRTLNVRSTLPRSGSYDAAFGAIDDQPDTISQSILTIPGRTYSMQYWLEDGDSLFPLHKSFTATFGTQSQTFGATQDAYVFHSLGFTATSTSTVLSFAGYNYSSYYLLDDVSVFLAPVPEPASIAALGIGALALVRRRKRS